FEWVHVQLHQQKGMISLSPPTICNSALQSASAGRSEKTYHPGIELTGTFSANTQQLLADQLVEIEGQCNHLLLAQGKALLKSRSELLK
ncbi:hypothetical protein, partial [Klebsiella pneumoniae]